MHRALGVGGGGLEKKPGHSGENNKKKNNNERNILEKRIRAVLIHVVSKVNRCTGQLSSPPCATL